MAIREVEVATHTLVRGKTSYDFVAPPDGTVSVRIAYPGHRDYRTLPRSVARALWARLVKQGYRRF